VFQRHQIKTFNTGDTGEHRVGLAWRGGASRIEMPMRACGGDRGYGMLRLREIVLSDDLTPLSMTEEFQSYREVVR
jgi:hypothetical protein